MLKTTPLCLMLWFCVLFSSAQLHLDKSEESVIALLGNDYNRVYDTDGNRVLSYVSEIKNHPVHGDYTLYSFYLFENNLCVMQQTLVPDVQMPELLKHFDAAYRKVDENVWRTKEDIYYLLSVVGDKVRIQIVKDTCYRAQSGMALRK